MDLLSECNNLELAQLLFVCQYFFHELYITWHMFQCIGKRDVDMKLLQDVNKLCKLLVKLIPFQPSLE